MTSQLPDTTLAADIAEHGWARVPGVLDAALVQDLVAAAEQQLPRNEQHGVRNLLRCWPPARALIGSAAVRALIEPVLGGGARPVRAIFFDKTPDAKNVSLLRYARSSGYFFNVGWHQDLTIAVHERIELPGYGPWSVKDGVPHVLPPVAILESMLTLRLHLDATDINNGALRVLPGSHRLGRIPASQVPELAETQSVVVCAAAAGDALLMRPLLAHASHKAARPTHRRVIHVEFAAVDLPAPLRWAEQP